MVEICANCGKIAKGDAEEFCCTDCKSNVCVMVPRAIFEKMVKSGVAKE